MNHTIKRGLLRFFMIQWMVVVVVVACTGWIYGGVAAGSAFLGGAASVLPHMVLAIMTFRHRGAINARKIVRAFYGGEAIKLGLSIIIFAMVFALIKVNPAAFFISFIIAQSTSWLAPWLIKTR